MVRKEAEQQHIPSTESRVEAKSEHVSFSLGVKGKATLLKTPHTEVGGFNADTQAEFKREAVKAEAAGNPIPVDIKIRGTSIMTGNSTPESNANHKAGG